MSCLNDSVNEIVFQIPLPEIVTQMLCLCLDSDIPSAMKSFPALNTAYGLSNSNCEKDFLKMQVTTYLSPILYWHCKMSKWRMLS